MQNRPIQWYKNFCLLACSLSGLSSAIAEPLRQIEMDQAGSVVLPAELFEAHSRPSNF